MGRTIVPGVISGRSEHGVNITTPTDLFPRWLAGLWTAEIDLHDHGHHTVPYDRTVPPPIGTTVDVEIDVHDSQRPIVFVYGIKNA